MYKSDMSLYRAIISNINVSKNAIYVKIPHILGDQVSVEVYTPTASQYGWTWDPAVGDQVIVAVEGNELDKVYLISVI